MKSPTQKQRIMPRQEINKSPVMYQTWKDFLFLHYEVSKRELQAKLPAGLHVDTFNDKSYIGIIPFFISNVHLPFLPPVPGAADFMELNIRTYVFDDDGTPGIWFFSLNANNILAVETAKKIPLPYKMSSIEAGWRGNSIEYKINRKENGAGMESEFIYTPYGDTFFAGSETLEFFLMERYILFFQNLKGKLKQIEVSHQPYPLQSVEVNKYDTNLISADGIKNISAEPVHSIFSKGPGEVKIFYPGSINNISRKE